MDSTEEKVFVACGRCDGAGSVSWGMPVSGAVRTASGTVEVPKVCFACGGAGGEWTTHRVLERRRKARERYAAKKEAERLARQERAEHETEARASEVTAARAAFGAERSDVVAALETLTGDFAEELRERLAETGTLSDGQCEAVLRIAAEKAAEPDPAPVVTGRIQVTGKIVSTKWVENGFSYHRSGALKAVVLDDRGFRVYGTVPTALEVEKGDRITFTANVETSTDDETFGFYKRPTKAERIA